MRGQSNIEGIYYSWMHLCSVELMANVFKFIALLFVSNVLTDP